MKGDDLKLILWILAGGFLFLLAVPVVCVILFAGSGRYQWTEISKDPAGQDLSGKISPPGTIQVWLEDKEKAVSVDFEEYVSRVVASEMPAAFEEEALKAQSVAARTYAMAKILKYEETPPASHPKTPVCSTTHCQVYKTEKKLIADHEEGWEETGWKKIKEACRATEGQMLYYDGQLVMQPLFFSSSGGQTENSEDVFVGAYPYLVSVTSPYEEEATHREEETVMELGDFAERIKDAYPEREIGEIGRDSVKILSRTAGGRVSAMQVGNGEDGVLKGTEVRTAMGLSSALFTIRFRGDAGGTEVVFTSSGSGHGVGMSQYGANGMAKEGHEYKEILEHYYSGSQVG